jgi:hypothetical protein
MSYVQFCGKYTIEINTLIKEILKTENFEKLIEEREVLGVGKKNFLKIKGKIIKKLKN